MKRKCDASLRVFKITQVRSVTLIVPPFSFPGTTAYLLTLDSGLQLSEATGSGAVSAAMAEGSTLLFLRWDFVSSLTTHFMTKPFPG